MVKQEDRIRGGRPFAKIFACNSSLRDIFLQVTSSVSNHNYSIFKTHLFRAQLSDIILNQFYRDALHRQAHFPQSRDLASKMDKMYMVWWEFLQLYLENRGGPFIDARVLQDIASYCAHIRPQLLVRSPLR
jgi:hypothetical protein